MGKTETGLSASAQWALTELQRKEVLSGCTSYVQRKLQIGYNAAAAIMQELEDHKYISEAGNKGTRYWLPRTAPSSGRTVAGTAADRGSP